jgi:hypothetical protein
VDRITVAQRKSGYGAFAWIHLEALAWAYPLAMVLIMVLALMQLAMPLKEGDWSYRHIWPFFWVLWLFGQALARRRYQ